MEGEIVTSISHGSSGSGVSFFATKSEVKVLKPDSVEKGEKIFGHASIQGDVSQCFGDKIFGTQNTICALYKDASSRQRSEFSTHLVVNSEEGHLLAEKKFDRSYTTWLGGPMFIGSLNSTNSTGLTLSALEFGRGTIEVSKQIQMESCFWEHGVNLTQDVAMIGGNGFLKIGDMRTCKLYSCIKRDETFGSTSVIGATAGCRVFFAKRLTNDSDRVTPFSAGGAWLIERKDFWNHDIFAWHPARGPLVVVSNTKISLMDPRRFSWTCLESKYDSKWAPIMVAGIPSLGCYSRLNGKMTSILM